MTRWVKMTLEKRDVSCRVRLLDEESPHTCMTLWQSLPVSGPAYHGKYARNEIYTLIPPLADPSPGLENPTVTPMPRDVCYLVFPARQLPSKAHGYEEGDEPMERRKVVDLAFFYGRNNLLLNGDIGWVPATVFGHMEGGFDEMAHAANDVWRRGHEGERLLVERAEEGS